MPPQRPGPADRLDQRAQVDSTPDVPTIADYAPGLEALSWFGLLAPAGTPAELVHQINAAANEAMKDPRIRERLVNEGMFLAGGTPQDFLDFLAEIRHGLAADPVEA